MSKEAWIYIPAELRAKIPPLYTTENTPDPMVWIKLFTPDSSWTWYLTEASAVMKDGEYRPINGAGDHVVFASESSEASDIVCFGLVIGHAEELRYFSLAEITSVRGPLGLRIERDLYFTPKALSMVRRRKEPAP